MLFDDGQRVMEPTLRVVSTPTFVGRTVEVGTGDETEVTDTSPADFYVPGLHRTRAVTPSVRPPARPSPGLHPA